MATAAATRISLGLGCSPSCDELAGPLLLQMGGGKYDECAVLDLALGVFGWREDHRTARKRANRAWARGYTTGSIDRQHHVRDIHEINVSASHRQGRPMSEAYTKPPDASPLPAYLCGRHHVRMYGVRDPDMRLVAYSTIYRAGDLALVSQILGHADHLQDEIMYLLFETVIMGEELVGGFLVYNRWDSGTDGLRFFKERLGFAPRQVEWLP